MTAEVKFPSYWGPKDGSPIRAAYKEKFGKKPFGGWGEAVLREKIA